ERNFVLNGIPVGPAHRFVRSDCLRFLEQERDRYDLIFLDPPTFSNSKAMTTSFDVRRDHRPLVEAAMARLAPGGLPPIRRTTSGSMAASADERPTLLQSPEERAAKAAAGS